MQGQKPIKETARKAYGTAMLSPTCRAIRQVSRIGMSSSMLRTIGSVNINSCCKRSPLSSAPLSMLKKFRMNVRAALGSEAGLKGKRRKVMSKAFDFNSFVQPLSNSCISSGSTSFRAQASPSQRGFGGGAKAMVPFVWRLAFFLDLGEVSPPPSLSLPRSLEKIRMLEACRGYVRPWVSLMGIVDWDWISSARRVRVSSR